MELNEPYFLVVFFGIFHVIGGLAVGKGLRGKFAGAGLGGPLIGWGLLMGTVPLVFDWFFLIRVGSLFLGLIGPALFVIAALIGSVAFTSELSRKNEKSIGAVLMGGCSLMLGLMLTPYLIEQARIRSNLGFVDYLCGGSIPIFFILIGTSFVWSGFNAMQKGRTFDEHIAEREMEIEEKASRKDKKRK